MVTTEDFRCRGIGLREELKIRDQWASNETAGQMRRRRYPRCPRCTHGSRCWPLIYLDAYVCRWGHFIDGRSMRPRRG